MKSTAQLTNAALGAIQAGQLADTQREPADIEQHRKLIDTLFDRLAVLFPAGTPAASVIGAHKAEWLKVLALHGLLHSEGVQGGLMRARKDIGERKFWPSPLQFVNWCRGSAEDHDLPAPEAAFREAVRYYRQRESHPWSHPIVYAALMQVGCWAFSQSSEKELRSQFEHAYAQLVRRVVAGQSLDVELPKALPAPGQSCRIAAPDCPGRLRALQLLGKSA